MPETLARTPQSARGPKSPGLTWKSRPRRAPAAPQLQAPPPCEVATLASELAAILRLQQALGGSEEPHDADLVEALESPDDFLRPSDMLQALRERQKAVEKIAVHRRPTSMKGVLFQLYLAACEAQCTDGMLLTKLASDEEVRLQKRDHTVEMLHRGAIAHLEFQYMDEDLTLIRKRYFPALYDAHQGCELAMRDGARLIAEAKAAPSTWREHRSAAST